MAATLPVLVLLLLVPSATAWTQAQGDAERSGVLAAPRGNLDVVQVQQLYDHTEFETTQFFGPAFVRVDDDLVGLLRSTDNQTCSLLRVDADSLTPSSPIPLESCENGWFQGYSPAHDRTISCTLGPWNSMAIQAHNATTGQLAWEAPIAQMAALAGDVPDPRGDASERSVWGCNAAAIDDATGNLYVAAFGTGSQAERFQHRIAKISLETGDQRWVTEFTPERRFANSDLLVNPLGVRADGPGAQLNFLPVGVAVTDNNVAVTGLEFDTNCHSDFIETGAFARCNFEEASAIGWIRDSGNEAGLPIRYVSANPAWAAMTDPQASAAYHDLWGSRLAATQDDRIAFAMDQKLYVVDSGSASVGPGIPLQLDTYRPADWKLLAWPGIVWLDDVVVASTFAGVESYDVSQDRSLWHWSGYGGDWRVLHTVASVDSVYIVVGRMDLGSLTPATTVGQATAETRLVVLAADTGTVRQTLPLPLDDLFVSEPGLQDRGNDPTPASEQLDLGPLGFQIHPWLRGITIVPTDGSGLILIDPHGQAAFLGPTREDRAPGLTPSNAFPKPFDEISVHVEPAFPVPLRTLFVDWGDGTPIDEIDAPENNAPFNITHRYDQPQRFEARITAVYEGGLTAADTVLFDVGGTPPEELNFMQTAFKAENQDTTWGLIGVFLVLLGALWGLFARRRRKSKIQRELERLDRVREQGLTDPLGAIHGLETHRQRLLDELARGKIDDAIYRILALRIANTLRRLTQHLLGPVSRKLSPAFYATLDATLEDGLVSANEADILKENLSHEDELTKKERHKVSALIEAWIHEPTTARHLKVFQGKKGPDDLMAT